MKTKQLIGANALVMSATWLPTVLFGIPLLFSCLYLSIAYESNLAIAGCVAALLLPAFIGARIQESKLAQIPCPDCGRKNMIQQEDSKDRQWLVCTDCQVRWRIDISNQVSS
jgi:predicted RNA-binding Zn-ribbon protein involved in translation (DUF1610 family)